MNIQFLPHGDQQYVAAVWERISKRIKNKVIKVMLRFEPFVFTNECCYLLSFNVAGSTTYVN